MSAAVVWASRGRRDYLPGQVTTAEGRLESRGDHRGAASIEIAERLRSAWSPRRRCSLPEAVRPPSADVSSGSGVPSRTIALADAVPRRSPAPSRWQCARIRSRGSRGPSPVQSLSQLGPRSIPLGDARPGRGALQLLHRWSLIVRRVVTAAIRSAAGSGRAMDRDAGSTDRSARTWPSGSGGTGTEPKRTKFAVSTAGATRTTSPSSSVPNG